MVRRKRGGSFGVKWGVEGQGQRVGREREREGGKEREREEGRERGREGGKESEREEERERERICTVPYGPVAIR